MSELPKDLKYSKSHEWVRNADDGTASVGITDHAQEQLGDLVYVELPEVGAQVEAGAECAVVESVKAASDIYSPVSGRILEVNEALMEAPETINSDPYGAGWIFRIELADQEQLAALMDSVAYAETVAAEEH